MRKSVLITLILFGLSICGYYLFEVVSARAVTLQVVRGAITKIETPLSLSQVSKSRLDLLLRVQDPNFFSHRGTDFLSGKTTTISQSLVKVLYFSNFRPGIAKIRQSLIARFALDSIISKDEQLFLFLNLTSFGRSDEVEIRGFEHASRVYFKKTFSEINDEEFLSLLAMLNGPNKYNIRLNPKQNAERVAQMKDELKI